MRMLTDIWEWIGDNWPGILIVVFALVLIAFGVYAVIDCIPELDEGVVIAKDYTPASNGRTYVYTGKFMVPVAQKRRERYSIMVCGVNKDGEEITEWWDVTEAAWMNVEIGDEVRRAEHE